MAYEKRVCVMKQVKKGFSADGGALSGAIYCERWGGSVKITPRLLGLAPVSDGKYCLALSISGKAFFLDFSGGRAEEFEGPSLENGFSALLCFVKGDAAEAVAFGSCGKERTTAEELLSEFIRSGDKKKKRISEPPSELPKGEENAPFRDSLAAAYDDEAIAAVDYYKRNENEDPAHEDKKEGNAHARGRDTAKNEAVPPRPVARTLAYYNTVRERLKEAFGKYPRDERFLKVFPSSEWVAADGALLGVICEEGTPKYLCVAKGEPFPEGASGGGTFVPYTPFSENEGMYIVFQDADTGDYVKVYDA